MRKVSVKIQADDAYKTYIEQIKNIRLLKAEEEQELARRVAEGDKDAIKRLIEANLRLVIKISQKYVSADISLMDIVQEGNIGLMHAAKKFDPCKKVRFASYAVLWIKQYIARFLVSRRRAIRLPMKKEEVLRKIYISEHILRQKLGRTPKIDEIAAETGYSVYDVELIMNISCNPISLEAEASDNDECSFIEICEDSHQCNPEREFLISACRNDTRRFLRRHLNCRERKVILHRFNFIDSDIYTFQKLGDAMGLTAEAVRQIEKRALNKIRTKSDELLSCIYA
jgi:RNA polymerase primary sigma factor